jgi:alkylhydroperoxidase family enzyme
MSTFLPPIERPKGLFMKMGYYFMRKQFGKPSSPMTVFSARMPTAFTMFYGKIGKLDKKLVLPSDTTLLIREQVASTNGCAYCMDTNRYTAIKKAIENKTKFDALTEYRTSKLFTDKERAALEYATELTKNKKVTQTTFDQLAKYYSEREICDIVYVVASEHLYNISNIGLNIGSDGFCEMNVNK